jgi:hypothetical protein
MADMPETQENKDNENHEDKEPGDYELVLSVTLVTEPISWFAVDPVGWQFQGRDDKWILEDDDLELKRSGLD